MNIYIDINKLIAPYLIIVAISFPNLHSSLLRFDIDEVDRHDIIEYRIKSGDNLWDIAAEHNSSIQHIKILNNLKSSKIHPESIIKIPNERFIKKMNLILEWEKAVLLRKKSEFMDSITSFKFIIQNSIEEELSVRSQFQIADIYLNDIHNYTFAIDNFKKIINKYPSSKERKKSVFMTGYIYSNYIESYSDAIFYYNMFLDEYPDDELSESVYYELELLDSLGIPGAINKKR